MTETHERPCPCCGQSCAAEVEIPEFFSLPTRLTGTLSLPILQAGHKMAF